MNLPWSWSNSSQIEDISRLEKFVEIVKTINWSSEEPSLEPIGIALDGLALAEIQYYYKRRSRQRWISYGNRLVIWFFASAGTLIPLLSATSNTFRWIAPWGYVAIATAVSAFAWNQLFGATDGHSRFVTTQLKLERLLTQFRIRRLELAANKSIDPDVTCAQYFKLYHAFADALYNTILSEVQVWDDRLVKAMQAIERQVQSQQSEATKKSEVDLNE